MREDTEANPRKKREMSGKIRRIFMILKTTQHGLPESKVKYSTVGTVGRLKSKYYYIESCKVVAWNALPSDGSALENRGIP